MYKNREILYSICIIIAVTVVSAFICHAFPSLGVFLIIADGLLYGSSFYFVSRYRTRKLRGLSEFLRRAQNKLPALEVSDQSEGEFSVLKSEIYKLLTKLHSQAELLEQEKKYLADTISDISHQLKTPMTSMNVMIDLLKDESLPASKRLEFTRVLRRQMSRMEWLLSAMLTMSRLDAGAILMKKENIRVSDLIANASEHLLIPMEIHGQHMVTEGNLEASFQGDLYWSSEAVSNILKNCMEHTHEGGTITVHIGESSLYTSVSIKDQGGGISEKDLPHIFERFYKGENASSDSVGIGLSLARQLIEKQNGTLTLTSVYGQYTVFKIKFYHHNI